MPHNSCALLARAGVVAAAAPDGTTTLPELSSAGPMILRRTGLRGALAQVHLVAGAAGPLGGDHWVLDVRVGPGARLCLRSVGATLALPDRSGALATLEINVVVEAGGFLDYACEPLVLAAGARLRSRTRVELADGAGLSWREELVTGRAGESSGAAELSLRVNHAAAPLLAQDLRVGPGGSGWSSSAVFGTGRALGSLLIAGAAVPSAPVLGVRSQDAQALCTAAGLAGPGVLVTALGADVAAVRRALDLAASDLMPSPER